MTWQIITMLLYIVLAPFLGGLLQGFDRKITARMQGRQGPPPVSYTHLAVDKSQL